MDFKKIEELSTKDRINLSMYIRRLNDNFVIHMDEDDYTTVKDGLKCILKILEK